MKKGKRQTAEERAETSFEEVFRGCGHFPPETRREFVKRLADLIRAAERDAMDLAIRWADHEASIQGRWLRQEMNGGALQNIDFRHGARTGAERCSELLERAKEAL